MCNNEQEREALHIRERTVSLWTYLNARDAFEDSGELRRAVHSRHTSDPIRIASQLPSGETPAEHDLFTGSDDLVTLIGGEAAVSSPRLQSTTDDSSDNHTDIDVEYLSSLPSGTHR